MVTVTNDDSGDTTLLTEFVLPFINVKSSPYNATFDGVTDDTTAWQAAVDDLPNGGTIMAPAGTTLITDTVTVPYSRIRIIGAGEQASIIKFQPTSGGKAAFKFKLATANTIAQNAIIGFGFTSTDTTLQKIMIDAICVEEMEIAHIASAEGQWTGASSIGVRVSGHQTPNVHDVLLAADQPLDLEPDPNHATQGLDQLHFFNFYSIAKTGNPNIKIACNLSNATWDGYQAWVKGSAGVLWSYAGATSSLNVRFANVRFEQGDAGAWAFDLEPATACSVLSLENVYLGSQKGVKGRKINYLQLSDVQYTGTTTSLDVDSTVADLNWINCNLGASGVTVTLTGLAQVFATQISSAGCNRAVPMSAHYTATAAPRFRLMGTHLWSGNGASLAGSGGIVNFTVPNAETTWLIFVSATDLTSGAAEGGIVIVSETGAGAGATLISGTTNFGVGNVPGKLTVFYQSASVVSLFNQLANAVKYQWTAFGF